MPEVCVGSSLLGAGGVGGFGIFWLLFVAIGSAGFRV